MIWSCRAVQKANGDSRRLTAMGMPCTDAKGMPARAGARSNHDGGIHALYADGSVHFLGDFVDSRGDLSKVTVGMTNEEIRLGKYMSVWDRLNLSTDGQTLDPRDISP